MSTDPQHRVYDSVLGLLSSPDNPTPLVRLNRVVDYDHAQVFAKLEWYNPFGAVKDRIAANLVRDAEAQGTLAPGKSLVEPSSGNTGLGLAMIGNACGYALQVPMSSAVPEEKRAVLRFLGADVHALSDTLCPAPGAPEGAIALAQKTAAENPDVHMLNQYANAANPAAHYASTGPEIWRQTQGKVTHLVAALGTCGTITGTGSYLKEQNPNVRIVGVHPQEGHDIPGVRSIKQLTQTRFFKPELYDDVVEIPDDEAFELCRRLNQEESLIAGPSSGLALAGLKRVLKDDPEAVVVVIFPDNVFKYASSLRRKFPDMFPDTTAETPVDPAAALGDRTLSLARGPHTTVSQEDAQTIHRDASALFVDVRPEGTFRDEHITGAVNLPFEAIADGHPVLPEDRDAPIITVCNRGNLSVSGLLVLQAAGYRNVRSLNDGTLGWHARGFPVTTANARSAP